MRRADDIIYVYDGTLDGFLSCVFEAFLKKENPALISKTAEVQLSFGAEIREIMTNPENAERVYKGIDEKLGSRAVELMYYATLSADPEAEVAALSYIRLGFKIGRKIYADLTDDRVLRMNKIAHTVSMEKGRYLEFLRFSEIEGNVLFGEFEPEPNVLPLIMPHFADRLNAQPFIIHDKGRLLAGVYDTKDWYLVPSGSMEMPEYSADEKAYRDLWKIFYNTIAVEERISERRRMQHLPKKYWKHITEMQL